MNKLLNNRYKSPSANLRFGASGAVSRRKCSANLEVRTPQEQQWKPRLRQAAGTLSASRGQRSAIGKRNKTGILKTRN